MDSKSSTAECPITSPSIAGRAASKKDMSESAVFVTAIARLQSIAIRFHQRAGFCLTSKMSHDRGWRAACGIRNWIQTFHFDYSYDSTRRDGHGRWLWRLVGPVFLLAT